MVGTQTAKGLKDMERANRPVRVAIYTRKSVEDADVHLEETECLFVKVPVAFRTISGRKQIVKDADSAALSGNLPDGFSL